MVLVLILVAVLTQSVEAHPVTGECPELIAGKGLSATISPIKPFCIQVNVPAGEAVQVMADHSADLGFRITGGGRSLVTHGFEFGRETVTLSEPGAYRIETIDLTKDADNSPATILISRNRLSLQSAAQWQEAELLATESKSSGKIEDISASLARWQALGDASSIARSWLKLGDAKFSGDPLDAHEAYERALKICHTVNELRCMAEAANNSGVLALQSGDFNGSLNRLQEAAKDWEVLGLQIQEGQTFSNLGILYSRTGNFQHAVNQYHQALVVLKDRNSVPYARVLSNLGLCYLSFAQYDKGAGYFHQAIAIEKNLKGAEGDLLRTRMNLGRALMLQGKLDLARTVLEETLALSENRRDRNLRAFTLNNLGQTLLRQHQAKEAEPRFKDALTLHRLAGDRRGEALALHYLGVTARELGNVAEARELLNQALQLRRDYGMRDEAADSLYELAALESAAGESQRAASLAAEAIPLLESVRSHVPGALRASFYTRRRNLLDLLVTIAMRPDNENAVDDGLIAAEFGRGRALLDVVAERRFSSSHPAALTQRQIRIRKEIGMLSQQAADHPSDYEKIKSRVQALIAEDEEIEASVRESISNREPGARPLSSVSALQRGVLSPQSAILEYQLGEQSSHLWLIRDRRIDVFTLPPRAVIEKQVSVTVGLFAKVLDRLRDPAKQAAFHDAMRGLSNILLGPLKGRDLPQLLILVLDGDLHRVPFAALQLSSGDYLGINHDLLRTPSAAFLMQVEGPRPLSKFPKSVIAFYDPIFSTSDSRVPAVVRNAADVFDLPRLPFGEELNTISTLVPKARYDFFSGLDATPENLRSAGLNHYAVVELSTHAVINDQIPEMSRIALSVVDRQGRLVNGTVLPYQLADLPLNGSVLVLSACDTALGKKVLGEGMIGFTSSLFSAGASQLVLTLSEVNAEATSSFLSAAYNHFLAPGFMSMEHSLTLARQAFLKSDRWSDPYYWASFVVVGAPAQTHVRQRDGVR